jgi:tetratricopeptide (TPR) repeat protein
MNWRDYEIEIHEQFQDMYPSARITHNVYLLGRYSKIERQIDILVEDYVAGDRIRIIVDAKYFSENIDVKEVECFIGMMEDVAADKGLLITQKGYSPAAINRAYNDPGRIELDILNFEELKQFQGFGAIPFSGKHGVRIPSPFSWIIDATKREGLLATLYQRGLTFEKATENKEWMYVNLFCKTLDINNLDAFCKKEEVDILSLYKKAKISYQNTVKRENDRTLLRTIDIEEYPTLEYTGLIEFKEFIFICVLFTPEECKEKNVKKLEQILLRTNPLNVNVESYNKSNLNQLERKLNKADNDVTKAAILISQGDILKKLERYDEAECKYDRSIEILNTSYGAIKGKIDLYLLTQRSDIDLNKVIDDLFELGPTNPTVCQDLIDLFSEYDRSDELFKIMKRKILDYSDNHEVQGNIYYHLGLLSSFLKKQNAKEYFIKAKNCFTNTLDSKHYVFKLIEDNLKE